MARALRVLVIGAQGFRRSDELVEIECFTWKQIANIVNPSDYDVILLNLTSLRDLTDVNWNHFFDKFTVEMTLEVLINGGAIVVVGDPRFLTDEPIYAHGGEDYSGREFLSWTGMKFDWDNRPGKTKKCDTNDRSTKPFLNYIDRISGWDYSLKDCKGPQLRPSDIARVLGKRETEFSSEVKVERLCENRSGGLVVFGVKLSIRAYLEQLSGNSLPQIVREGLIIFLPRINVSDDEVVTMVLNIFRISVVVPEPPWASAIIAPGQLDIDQRIDQIKNKITELEENLKDSLKEREEARRCVHLLYKLGGELEDAVREILGSLGSEVEPPIEKGKEDGWLTVEIDGKKFEGVLEIKGTKRNQFTVEGPRQLMEWKTRGKLNRQKIYKGIFVGNSAVERDASERQFPFAEDWIGTAKLDEQVALECRHLYELYCLDCEGKLDRNEFWRSLFQTSGVFDPAPLRNTKT